MTEYDKTIDWLVSGDPTIRWQVLRDLLDAPESAWQAERRRTLETGWGVRFMEKQDPDGRWGGGYYSPKWVSSTYTLLSLCHFGIPADCELARRGASLTVGAILGERCDDAFQSKLASCDRCIVGMMLQIAVYFGVAEDRVDAIVENLLNERMADDGWNCRKHCRPKPHHSSFHTTLNVLDGLRAYVERGTGSRTKEVKEAEWGALELLLQHRLYKSDKTGEIINPKFTMLSYPHRWHYDALRGLDYFARVRAGRDPRLQDAIDLLLSKRLSDGTWPVQNKYSGKVFFEMEKIGGPSRWNTLRALRVLRWWQGDAKLPS